MIQTNTSLADSDERRILLRTAADELALWDHQLCWIGSDKEWTPVSPEDRAVIHRLWKRSRIELPQEVSGLCGLSVFGHRDVQEIRIFASDLSLVNFDGDDRRRARYVTDILTSESATQGGEPE